jgi:hypothetical protein
VVVERSGSASRFKAKSSLDAKVEFVNSLGMKFARVPGTKVFFGVWDVRVRDYQAYAHSQPGDEGLWRDPGFRQESNHPVVMVSWAEAKAFCEWLSAKEGRRYRLCEYPRRRPGRSVMPPRNSAWNRNLRRRCIPGLRPDRFPWDPAW